MPEVVLYSVNEWDIAMLWPQHIKTILHEDSFASMNSRFSYTNTTIFSNWIRDYVYNTESNVALSE